MRDLYTTAVYKWFCNKSYIIFIFDIMFRWPSDRLLTSTASEEMTGKEELLNSYDELNIKPR